MTRYAASIAFGLLWLAVAIWALVVLPTLVPHAEGVRSAAEAAGYNNRIAHILAVMWLVAGLVVAWALARRMPADVTPPGNTPDNAANQAVIPLMVILATAILYFPYALAWVGPVFEDGIHVNALHRYFAGDMPYRDFEFLYGPLMLFLPAWWLELFSGEFSLVGFYSYVAVLEALTLLLILYPIQKYIAGFWARLCAFVLMAQLYFNVMIGPNQNGLRKAVGVLLLLAVANRPYQPRTWIACGIFLGLFLSYSQEFGAATAVGIFLIYASLFVKMRRRAALAGLFSIGALSAVTWISAAWIMLGKDVTSYVHELRYLSSQFDAGEAAFAYHWTLAGLALFALLAIGIVYSGRLLAQKWDETPGSGELLMLGGLGYAALALKSGLSRADQWHLMPAVAVVAFAVLLPLGARYVTLDRPVRVVGIVLIAVMAFSFSFGQLRIARYTLYQNAAEGWQGYLAGDRTECALTAEPVLPSTNCQNGNPDPALLELTEFLSAPPYRGQPIFIYQPNTTLAAELGVHRAGHLTDGFIYGDARAEEEKQFLADNPDLLVVTARRDFDLALLGGEAPLPKLGFPLLGTATGREWRALISSVHIRGVPVEYPIMLDRWQRFIGSYIAANYQPLFLNDDYVVLERIR